MTLTVAAQDSSPRRAGIFGLFLRLLSANWTWGRLTLILPDGSRSQLVGAEPGHAAVIHIHDARTAWRVLTAGDIGFAEGYMAGEWDSPELAVLLETLVNNYDQIRRLFDGNAVFNALNWVGHRLNRNDRKGSRRNIHAHYDLGNAFYGAWLDETMTYSSGRFLRTDQSLAQAQREKYAALARRMDLRPGHHVLEIGCGWGGFAEHAARDVGASVTAITISREQHDFARRRMFQAGLADRVDVQLIDYRDVRGSYDRVASIEMFEAVGREYWPTYFAKIRDVLKPGGAAGLQIITMRDDLFDDYDARTDFIQKYVFPGGVLPSEERLAPVIDAAGLRRGPSERFGADYARTLADWARRFEASWSEVKSSSAKFDERFRRLWLFYLAYCEAGFRSQRTNVIQLALHAPA